jgi:hypothetical protein
MKAPPLAAALLACGCASSPWVRTESVSGGELYVPKVYAPLLPGSIYPDRKVPIPATARPAMVLVCPSRSDCRAKEILDSAARRGFVVLITRSAKAAIAPRPEVDSSRTGTVIVTPASLKVEIHAPSHAGASPSSASRKVSFAALLESAPPETSDGTVLKLYSPNEKGLLPNEAFRDAVEWLAGELETR